MSRPSRTFLFALSLACCASAATAQVREIPDDQLTPGVVASTDEAEVCGRDANGLTYSQAHRKTTLAEKIADFARYGLPYPSGAARRLWEDDHRLEIALGGADAPANRWPQPGTGTPWTYHLKDRLEQFAWESVCIKHTVPLAEAQSWFLPPSDWRVAYCRYFPCAKPQ